MRTLEELERLFDDLKPGQLVQIGFRNSEMIDLILPIDFRVRAIDYSLFLNVEGIRVPLHVDPDCVVEITQEDGLQTVWLGLCGPTTGDDRRLIFFGPPEFRITIGPN